MKYFIIMLTSVFYIFSPVAASALGGDDDFDDLLALYIDEKYEKLTEKAYAYTQNDKYRKEPLPYIYCAMGYYEMSKDMQYQEDYPRAQQDALKYAIKFRKKDKDLKYWEEYQDFISELRTTVIEDAENMLYEVKTIKKSHKIYRYLTDLDPSDGSAWLMRGYCEVKMRIATEADKAFKIGTPLILGIAKIEDVRPEQAKLLKFGLMTYATYLKEEGMRDSSYKVIDMGAKYFEDDEEYKKKFDEIKGN